MSQKLTKYFLNKNRKELNYDNIKPLRTHITWNLDKDKSSQIVKKEEYYFLIFFPWAQFSVDYHMLGQECERRIYTCRISLAHTGDLVYLRSV